MVAANDNPQTPAYQEIEQLVEAQVNPVATLQTSEGYLGLVTQAFGVETAITVHCMAPLVKLDGQCSGQIMRALAPQAHD